MNHKRALDILKRRTETTLRSETDYKERLKIDRDYCERRDRIINHWAQKTKVPTE